MYDYGLAYLCTSLLNRSNYWLSWAVWLTPATIYVPTKWFLWPVLALISQLKRFPTARIFISESQRRFIKRGRLICLYAKDSVFGWFKAEFTSISRALPTFSCQRVRTEEYQGLNYSIASGRILTSRRVTPQYWFLWIIRSKAPGWCPEQSTVFRRLETVWMCSLPIRSSILS